MKNFIKIKRLFLSAKLNTIKPYTVYCVSIIMAKKLNELSKWNFAYWFTSLNWSIEVWFDIEFQAQQ